MKRIIACLLTGVLAVGMMVGCSKKLTPEEHLDGCSSLSHPGKLQSASWAGGTTILL